MPNRNNNSSSTVAIDTKRRSNDDDDDDCDATTGGDHAAVQVLAGARKRVKPARQPDAASSYAPPPITITRALRARDDDRSGAAVRRQRAVRFYQASIMLGGDVVRRRAGTARENKNNNGDEDEERTWYNAQEYRRFMKDRHDTVRVYQSVRGDMTHLQDHYTIRGLEHLIDTKLYLGLQQCQKRLVAAVVSMQRQNMSAETIRDMSLQHSAASVRRAIDKAGPGEGIHVAAVSLSSSSSKHQEPTRVYNSDTSRVVEAAANRPQVLDKNMRTTSALPVPSCWRTTMNSRLMLLQHQTRARRALSQLVVPSVHTGRCCPVTAGMMPPLVPLLLSSAGRIDDAMATRQRLLLQSALLTRVTTTFPTLHADPHHPT